MNIEVEVKIEVESLKRVREKVSTVGKLVKSIKQVDEYYVPCHRNFFIQKPHPTEWLRIRTNPDKVVFEYDRSINKKASGEQDCAEEYETIISDPAELRKILEFLDFNKVMTVNKQREYWDCADLEIVLDKVEGLGNFIEVEAKGDFESAAEAKKACLKFIKELGIENAENIQIFKGYPVLLSEKQKNQT